MTDHSKGPGAPASGPTPTRPIRAKGEPVAVRVMAAMSMPRLGFTDNLFQVMNLPGMNIQVRKHSGAFWEQSLSGLLYGAVEEDFDYVVTIDYDTVFDPRDLFHMLRLIVAKPEAAAVFPIQMRREVDEALVGLRRGDMVSGACDQLVEASTGHFGLTLLRVAALKQLPHPWFHSQPNAEGKWGEGRVDADIYFWNKLRAHGFKAYCAYRVVVGHLQQIAVWPGEDLQPVHQYFSRYGEEGDRPTIVSEAALSRRIA